MARDAACCRLPAATPSLEAHRRRFTECGWQRAEAHDMDHVYRWVVQRRCWGRCGRCSLVAPLS
jgi:hypothetical protein